LRPLKTLRKAGAAGLRGGRCAVGTLPAAPEVTPDPGNVAHSAFGNTIRPAGAHDTPTVHRLSPDWRQSSDMQQKHRAYPDNLGERLVFRAPTALVHKVDEVAAGLFSTRSEAVRQLVIAGLEARRTVEQKAL
jgi:hypothetical protein